MYPRINYIGLHFGFDAFIGPDGLMLCAFVDLTALPEKEEWLIQLILQLVLCISYSDIFWISNMEMTVQ